MKYFVVYQKDGELLRRNNQIEVEFDSDSATRFTIDSIEKVRRIEQTIANKFHKKSSHIVLLDWKRWE